MSVATADHGAWAVDRIVRVLATACERENRDVPPVLAVVVGAEAVTFRLRTPDERPPSGWTAEDDGRTWRAELRWLQSAPVAESVREPYPRLLSLGYSGQGFVLLDLSQAGGIVGVEGDLRQARDLVGGWARELTTSPWSRGVRVVRVGFRTGAAVDGVLDARALSDVDDTLADAAGGVLLMAGPPGGRDAERVRALAEDPEGRWAVAVVGRVESARWRFTVDAAGTVDTGLLGGPVARRWSPSTDLPSPEDTGVIPVVPASGTPGTARTPRRAPSRRSIIVLAGTAAACVLVAAAVFAIPLLKDRSADGAAPTSSGAPASVAPTAVPPGGTGAIRSMEADMCVDSDQDPAMALNGVPTGGHAFTSACTAAPTQRWTEGPLLSADSPRGPDMFRLVDAKTLFCLDSNEDGIYTLPCLNPNQFQMWRRIEVPAPSGAGLPKGAKAVIYRNQATGRCLSVAKTDRTLRTQPCGDGGPWTGDMLFERMPG